MNAVETGGAAWHSRGIGLLEMLELSPFDFCGVTSLLVIYASAKYSEFGHSELELEKL